MRWSRGGRVAGTVLACLTAWQCGSGDDGPTQPPATAVPTTVTKAGDGQSGTVNAALPASISVTLRDQHGNLMSGVTVSFTVTAGGGRTVGTSAVTTAQGVAAVTWILGTAAGTNNNTVTATIIGYQGPVPTFTASATPSAVYRLVKITGDSQTGEVVQPLPQLLSVMAQDGLGNPVPGVSVEWGYITGRGTPSPATSVTDASGIASTAWSPGPVVGAFTQSIRAYTATVSGTTFTASTVFTSGALTLAAGDNQSGVVSRETPVQPSVKVSTPGVSGVPVEGVPVGWVVMSGGGSISPTLAYSDVDGVARTEWTLGATEGVNNQGLRASASGLVGSPVSFVASATRFPAQLSIVSGNGQTGAVGTALPLPLTVLVGDSAGVPIPGVVVSWWWPWGETTSVTDAAGRASRTLTLPEAADSVFYLARVPSSSYGTPELGVWFRLLAVAGPPAHLALESGNNQSATVGTPLSNPIVVRVTDSYGNVTAGATVNWTAATGSVAASSSVTDAAGLASTQWTIGTVAGVSNQSATGRLAGVSGAQASFTATARAGPAAALTLVSGDNQGAVIGTPLGAPLVVVVKDSYGNPVPNVDVRWNPGSGGGWTTANSVRTLADGSSTNRRTLGAGVGAQTTLASVTGATPASVTFNATGSSFVSEYNIELRYLTSMSPTRQAAFVNAAARWSSIIYGNLTSAPIFAAPGAICGPSYPGISETVDDILIFVTIDSIDGPGKILGSAGPCLYRSGSKFTAVGAMRFDIADIPLMESNGIFESVILHEMGHVIGFGTLWTVPPSVLTGAGTADPYSPGVNAVDAFNGSCCVLPFYGNRVPVEAGGGPGTRDAHWRESVMGAELMTGYVSLTSNPLSAITVGSLRDMGYTVSSAYADPYVVGPANVQASKSGSDIHLREGASEWTLQSIDGAGRITRVR